MNKENDDMLSQEEINALLNGIDEEDENDAELSAAEADQPENKTSDRGNYLSDIEVDTLGEIGNISFGSSATALSSLMNQKVEITTPGVSVIHSDELVKEFPKPHVAVSVEYTSGFEGLNLLVIKTSDAAIIADLMMGNDGTAPPAELGEMELSAVQEAMNQMMGSASTSMSTVFNKKVDITPPNINMMDLKENPEGITLPDDEIMVNISFHLKVGQLIDSKIMQLLTVDFAKDMVAELMNPAESETASPAAEAETAPKETEQQQTPEPKGEPQRSEEPVMSAQSGEDQASAGKNQQISSRQHREGREADVQPAAFSNFDGPSLSQNEQKNLDMLMDIPLEVTVELGRTKRSIKDILEMAQGSIVELDKLAGEPVDVLVNQRLIAKGEVVVIDENFGVRVTDIVSRKERLNNLR
ncbi:flagellar motor switch phosphatase FliY [Salisediminibacterium halotolerans]|uniref:flagellar motor switch phosphatase FliY n=1 Tax=Salisediminibacterium halotolerans TaxID=517425 RepID=UPI000EAEB1E9|nr:flagellar motor switch phosphatase FliY [Salisediminibacterium halotolerans]RLJ74210.1 flagellar motor switch protein FliN/FliY [Actinophytocola xinjiangensis]RPE87697.1 flagellar motor switch protein FliN/FliY [Salisediminibacterium halotolerans]TWG35047.1 flagellar motor switch protein FliN/FliY [Salisediminibacterium halotolerans]GEL06666.1 flagellar motor switch phosphatase FliY [Salisediminibacterium halotolerans]